MIEKLSREHHLAPQEYAYLIRHRTPEAAALLQDTLDKMAEEVSAYADAE